MTTRAAAALCLFLVPLLALSTFADVVDLSDAEVRFDGAQSDDQAGLHVANAGDVNGDGIDDMLISAPTADSNGTNAGTVYLIYGATDLAESIDLRFLASGAAVTLIGADTYDEFGEHAAGVGDLNQDGYDDVIVGADRAGSGSRGIVYVIFGADDLPDTIEMDELGAYGFTITGADYGDRAGDSVAPAGDFNGDGRLDIVIGAPRAEDDDDDENRGAAYIVFGTASPVSVDLDDLGSAGMRIYGADEEDRAGDAVWSAGDFNDDGYDDVVIGAERADPNGSQSGAAYVVFGSENPPQTLFLDDLDGSSGVVIRGRSSSDNLGEEVALAGDFNGDGIPDILLGAEDAGVDREGEAYIIFGGASVPAVIEADDLESTGLGVIIVGDGDNTETSESLRSAGDFNLDGFYDVIVGSPHASNGGAAYVIYGSSSPDSLITVSEIEDDHTAYEGGSQGDAMGEAVGGSGGDFNGDGAPDLIIGDPDAEGTGEVVLVFGTALVPPSGLVATVVAGEVNLAWQNGASYDEVQVYRDGTMVAQLAGDESTYLDATMAVGAHSYCVMGLLSSGNSLQACDDVIVPEAVSDLSCCAQEDQLTVNWTNNGIYDSIEIRRDGILVATLAGDATSFSEAPGAGSYDMEVTALLGTDASQATGCLVDVVAAPIVDSCALSGLPCAGLQDVDVLWTNSADYDQIEVLRDGVVIATLAANEESFKDTALADGIHDYSLVATIGCSSATSAICAAEVVLFEVPAIAADPLPASLCLGDDYTFTVTAAGTDLSYQWRKDGVELVGETSETLMLLSVTLADIGDYDLEVSNVCGTAISAPANLRVRVAPTVTSDPLGHAVCEGASTTLTVSATGTDPLAYQWRKDEIDLAGENAADLNLDLVELDDAASYDCVITNMCGAATSAAATVTIDEPPYVATTPIPQTVCAGEPVTFSVSVDSELPVSYQWRRGGAELAGETGESLTIAAADSVDAGDYDVQVTNSCGADTSSSAELVVDQPPTISIQPAAQIACEGSDVILAVTASGSGTLAYQWRKDGIDIAGATASALTLSNAGLEAEADYDVAVSNHCDVVISAAATVTIHVAPTVTLEPADSTVCDGAAVLLTVAASGTEPLTYQWRKAGDDLVGETGTSLAIASATPADIGSYDVLVSNGCGSATSISAVVDVRVAPTVTTEPVDQTLCEGSDATFTVAAIGAEPLTYQWQKNGSDIVGADQMNLTLLAIDSSDDAAAYRVVISNDCGTVTSLPATLTVDVAPQMTLDPQGSVVCRDDALTFSASAIGTAPLGYQWQKDGVDIIGANADSLTIASAELTDAGDYAVVVSNHCGSITSAPAAATVQDPVAVIAAPIDTTLCDGARLQLAVVASGDPLPSYQWRKDGLDLPGATDTTIDIEAVSLADAGSYDVVITNPCGSETSTSALVVVEELVAVVAQPVSTDICFGQALELTVEATGAAPLSYQWQKDGVDIVAATSATFAVAAVDLDSAGDYAVTVTNHCGSRISDVATIVVLEAPAVTVAPADETVCSGEVVNLTVAAIGSEPLAVQWQKDGVDIPGAITSALSILDASVEDAGNYRAVFSNTCGSDISAAALVSIEVPPTVTAQPLSDMLCEGQATTLMVSVAGSDPMSYQWYKDQEAIAGATSESLAIINLSDADSGSYHVVIDNPCGTVTSEVADLVVRLLPRAAGDPVSVAACEQDAVELSFEASGAEPLFMQWQKDGMDLPGETAATLSWPSISVQEAGNYELVVYNDCGSTRSAVATVTVEPLARIVSQPSAGIVCLAADFSFEVVATGNDLTYQWRKDGVALAGEVAAILELTRVDLADAGDYDVVVAGTCNAATSIAAELEILSPPTVSTDPLAQILCAGEELLLSIEATGSAPLSFQWQKDGADLVGETSSDVSVPAALAADGGDYQCVIMNDCGTVTSAAASVTVQEAVVIVGQPEDQTVCVGDSVVLVMGANGTAPVTYQWRRNGADLAGEVSSILNIEAAGIVDAGSYEVVVTNPCGNETSLAAIVTVNQAPALIGDLGDQEICLGDAVTFTVQASGTEPMSYQWQKDGIDLVARTTNELFIAETTLADAGSYVCIASNDCGQIRSLDGQLTIRTPAEIVTEPVSLTVCENEAASFELTATGSEPLSYRWFKNGALLPDESGSSMEIPVSAVEDAGSYSAIATNNCGIATSVTVQLIVDVFPSVVSEPEDQTLCEGDPVTLTADVVGTEPLSYQWQKDGVDLIDETSPALTIAAGTVQDQGIYQLVITNHCGTVSSAPADITVNEAPEIISGPQDATICADEEALLSVIAASSTALSYQWRKDGIDLVGATSESFTASESGDYAVVVSNVCSAVVSEAATVTVRLAPTIVTDAEDFVVCVGSAATLTVQADGSDPLAYQWQKDGIDLVAETGPMLEIAAVTAADQGQYQLQVTNDCGGVSSLLAEITVREAPTITVDPESMTPCAGDDVLFVASAVGAGPLTYQWQKDGVNILDASSETFAIDGVEAAHAADYRVVVTNDCGVATSASASLSVLDRPTIDVAPAGTTVCDGEFVELSVAASGDGEIAYQWLKDGVPISGARSSAHVIDSALAADAGSYSVTVSNLCGAVSTEPVELNIELAPVVSEQPQDARVCEGGAVTLAIVVSGSAPLEFQWYQDGEALAGATDASLNLAAAALSDAGDYSVVASNPCGALTSAIATLTVDELPAVITAPVTQVACEGDRVELSVSARGAEPLTYQWQRDGVDIPGAVAASLVIDAMIADDAGDYGVVVSNPCHSIESDSAELEFDAGPSIQLSPFSRTICAGEPVTFIVVASGMGELSYQWRKDGIDIDGATGSSLTLDAVMSDDEGDFAVVVSNGCGAVVSQKAVLALAEAPRVTGEPVAATVCAGARVRLSVEAAGTWPLNYQWRRNGIELDGEIRSSLTLSAATALEAGDYDVVISNLCGDATSTSVAVLVNEAPSIVEQPVGADLCGGADVTFAPSIDSHETPSYQWFKDGEALVGATNAALSLVEVSADDVGEYSVVASNDCGATTSQSALLTVDMAAAITLDLAHSRACEGDDLNLVVEAAGAEPLSYQWQKDGVDISGATGPVLSIETTVISDAGEYSVSVSNGCGSAASSTATVTVTTPPSFDVQPLGATVCTGDDHSWTVAATGTAPLGYQWYRDGVELPGATDATLDLEEIDLEAAGEYTVTVSNECGDLSSDGAILTVHDVPVLATAPAAATICEGEEVTLNVVAESSAALSYQWQLAGEDLTGATTDSITVSEQGDYGVVVSNLCASVASDLATVTVRVAPTVSVEPVATVACAGDPVTLGAEVLGSEPLSFQWQQDGVDVDGATDATLSLDFMTTENQGLYQLRITNDCGSVSSNSVRIDVHEVPVIATEPSSATLCEGDELLLFVLAESGLDLGYQWQKDGIDIAGATMDTFAIDGILPGEAGDYRVRVSNDCGTTTSAVALVEVKLLPQIDTQPSAPTALCEGDLLTLSVAASGSDPLSYQWRRDQVEIPGATSVDLTIDSLMGADAGSYDVIVSNDCGSRTSDFVAITVGTAPTIDEFAESVIACSGDNVTLSVATDSFEDPTYQWQKNGTDIVGATRETYTIVSIVPVNAGDYSVIVTNGCGSVTSPNVELTVQTSPSVVENPVGDLVELGAEFTFAVVADGSGLEYQWRHDGVAIDGATEASFSIDSVAASDTGDYDVVLTSDCGTVTSTAATLSVGALDSDLVLSCCNADGVSSVCWTSAEEFDRFLVYSDGVLLADLAGDARCYTVDNDVPGSTDYQLWGERDGDFTAPLTCTVLVLAAPISVTCEVLEVDGLYGDVEVTWESNESYDVVMVYRDGEWVGDSSGNSFVDSGVVSGEHSYRIEGTRISTDCDSVAPFVTCDVLVVPDAVFRRGDANLDENIDVSDTIHILGYVFQDQRAPGCLDAADVNDDGYISVADGIYIINYMFADGEVPPSPGATECGADPTDDDDLDCQVTADNCL